VPFSRDFYGNYLGDALHHLRFTHARSLPFEYESLEILGRGFVAVHEHAANRAGKPRWTGKAESDAALIWEGTRRSLEVDPELPWSYRQPQRCRP
jgi:hypothetical protein